MKYLYCLSKEKSTAYNGIKKETFSLCIKENGKVIRSISAVFTNKAKAEHFINLCNTEQLDPIHLDFVLEEYL